MWVVEVVLLTDRDEAKRHNGRELRKSFHDTNIPEHKKKHSLNDYGNIPLKQNENRFNIPESKPLEEHKGDVFSLANKKEQEIKVKKGPYRYIDNTKYEGDKKDGKKEGKGTFLCKSLGILYYPTGERYEGDWIADKKDGRGNFVIK